MATEVVVAGRIDDNPSRAAPAFLNPGNQLALGVGLPEIDREPQFLRRLGAEIFHIIERRGAVFPRLARAQHVEGSQLNTAMRFMAIPGGQGSQGRRG